MKAMKAKAAKGSDDAPAMKAMKAMKASCRSDSIPCSITMKYESLLLHHDPKHHRCS